MMMLVFSNGDDYGIKKQTVREAVRESTWARLLTDGGNSES